TGASRSRACRPAATGSPPGPSACPPRGARSPCAPGRRRRSRSRWWTRGTRGAENGTRRPAERRTPRICAPGARSAPCVTHHRLHLEELLEAEDAPLAAVARLLVAAEGGREVGAGAVQ